MELPAWLLVVLTIGTVMRLTRLITADYITKKFREGVERRMGEDSNWAYLVTCDYCSSMYVAPPVATVAVLWGDNRVVIIGLLALTASFIAGFTAANE